MDLLSVVIQIVSAFYAWYYFAMFLYAFFWFGKHLHACLLAYKLACDKLVWYVQVFSLFSEQFYSVQLLCVSSYYGMGDESYLNRKLARYTAIKI